jgi:hypothetical protein
MRPAIASPLATLLVRSRLQIQPLAAEVSNDGSRRTQGRCVDELARAMPAQGVDITVPKMATRDQH